MEKRYQVFISSTFQDLQNARQEVSQALLRADCFPAGMELFPAADEEQFEYIKTIIDQSDYYILISAGRYGSIHPETGLSYTEMEYDYAVETGKPVIRLLHKDPKNIADEGDEKLFKLMKFRTKMSHSRLVAYWETADQLGKEVAYALMNMKQRNNAIGWMRASDGIRLASFGSAPSEEISDENLNSSDIEMVKKVAKIVDQRESKVAGILFLGTFPVFWILVDTFDFGWISASLITAIYWLLFFAFYLGSSKEIDEPLKKLTNKE